MHLRHRLIALALLCLSLFAGNALAADSPSFEKVPDVLRPGKYYDIAIQAAERENAVLHLMDADDAIIFTIFNDYPLLPGLNLLAWDGMALDYDVLPQGDYTLRLITDSGAQVETPLRIGAPYPLITAMYSDQSVLLEGGSTNITFNVSESGNMKVQLSNTATQTTKAIATFDVAAGANSYEWACLANGAQVPAGEYALIFTLATANGVESMAQHVYVQVQSEETAEPVSTGIIIEDASIPTTNEEGEDAAADGTQESEESEEEVEPTPTPGISAPYSTFDDGTFWSMTPGELDDDVIWDILMQPITVYDDGKIKGAEHVYLMENPDGTGAKVAQIHGKSQGLHIISPENEHGYVLVEAFSNYDPDYQPTTDEEREHAFDLKQGYIKTSGLKTVDVKTDYAILIDKKTQRLYIYEDGKRITELLIATGKIEKNKYYNETIPGEYITISHVGGFWSGNMYCDMAIRINGGILLHEVPHKVNADKSKNYSSFEAYLGSKQSHGCIRIQRLKNEDGYNHRWLWENLDRKGGYKVIIWDDLNRLDMPTTWYPNPEN